METEKLNNKIAITSPDGINGRFKKMTLPDGIKKQKLNLPASALNLNDWISVTYGKRLFLAVAIARWGKLDSKK